MKGLSEMTPDELGDFIDSHIITALVAADGLFSDRDEAEYYLRNRLIWAIDSWPTKQQMREEDARRRMERLSAAIGVSPAQLAKVARAKQIADEVERERLADANLEADAQIAYEDIQNEKRKG